MNPVQKSSLHPANIIGNPVSTILGIAVAGNSLMSNPSVFPHDTAGWISFGLQMAVGLLGIFA